MQLRLTNAPGSDGADGTEDIRLIRRCAVQFRPGGAIKPLAGIIKQLAPRRTISRTHPSRAPRFGSCAMKYVTLAFAFLLGCALLMYAQPWS